MDMEVHSDTDEAKGPAKKLGLSKVVYGLGMSARDALVAFVVASAALFPVMYFGQGKSKIVDMVAKIPEKLHGGWSTMLGERSGKVGKALTVSFGVATIIGYIAHAPGLFRGPKKIKEAEDRFNTEVETNASLYKENKQLTEELKHDRLSLMELKKQNASFTEREKTRGAEADTGPTIAM